jgi:hypothetical protein
VRMGAYRERSSLPGKVSQDWALHEAMNRGPREAKGRALPAVPWA